MTTDTNLSQIVFNRLSNEKYHELKTSGQLNDQQFYITPDLDTNPGLIQDYMSNCITKIPQHINLELSTDGVLTLKAGSKVYIPNGVGKFDEVITESDFFRDGKIWNGLGIITYQNGIDWAPLTNCVSSDTTPAEPKNGMLWYDTTNNIIKRYNGTDWFGTRSLPLAIFNSSAESTELEIIQVFNGIGYIGAVAFAVPGVQVIIPNGFNSNGQLNNYTATVERVLIKDYAADGLLGSNLALTLTNSPLLSAGDMIYVEEENQMYKDSIAELNKRTEIEIAKVTTDSTRITSLTPLPIYNRILGSYQTSASGNVIGNHIGQIGYTTRTDIPEGCSWCDGAEYTQAQFPDVYQMLVGGKIQSTTVTDFDSKVSTNGYCDLFGLDTSNERFKVPKLLDKYVMDLADDVPVVGNGMALGLTNGTSLEGLGFSGDGIVIHRAGDYGVDVGTACSGSGSTRGVAGVTTDPEKSGLIADTSNLGKTVTLKAYVVLYSSVAGASEVQAAEFIQGLSGKANTDLSNINTIAKNTIAGLGMPSEKYIDLDLQASGTEYEAPANGYYFLYMGVTSNGQYIGLFNIKNLGGGTGDENFNYGVLSSNFSGINPMVMLPVKKGDIVKVWYSAPTKKIFRFIYAEGSKE